MKSSSRLFPVQLASAEVVGSLAEDVYSIKPQNSTDKSVQIAVTHLSPLPASTPQEPPKNSWWMRAKTASSPRLKPALILLHGCYQNRRLWFSETNCQLVNELISQGFDVWLMEQRGHGMSPQNQAFERNTLDDCARYDIPAVNAFVTEKTGTKPSWVGYGEGAGALLLALGCGALKRETVTHVTGIGSPFVSEFRAKLPLSNWLSGPLQLTPTQNLQRGPEIENSHLLKQLLKESAWPGIRGEAMGINLWHELAQLEIPLYWLAAGSELGKLDSGLRELHRKGMLEVSQVLLDIEQLLPEKIQDTLADTRNIALLMDAVSSSVSTMWQGETFIAASSN
ncbi:MAG: alpha/beta fold hydrolase [Candidatus Pelagadaptatus aseana]|uniref:alpha/beta hydrolase n=1 Tax=Candidatus Pelagadaptatus aseana TaxID=3120508 RepID=UPI0039B179E9